MDPIKLGEEGPPGGSDELTHADLNDSSCWTCSLGVRLLGGNYGALLAGMDAKAPVRERRGTFYAVKAVEPCTIMPASASRRQM